ncbi:transcriptional regulator [Sphaerisporangium rufum]|uniref:Transcriptional regulator n=1 Tax=Sphaerisporangium rufum TaxID=1381558 RepID=A0A919R3K1_9ACTN|nr:helix-turn-helix transcriptional regulator [Sphaerisporangium rufum]GII76475.1 transcriptional regulator [Sphaerisporangium rufum]
MGRPVDIDPEASGAARFAYELRRHRRRAGLTQEQLGRRIGFSESLIGMVETQRRVPTEDFARRCDKALGLDGMLDRLHQDTWPPLPPVPEHFRDWAAEERRATALRLWDPLLIPGLFQTEAYARTLFDEEPGITGEQIDQRLQGRMRRKNTLTRDDAPMIWSLIDEGVLHRPIGTRMIMREQLEHLLDISRRPRVAIQMVPYGARASAGLLGAFGIAEMRGSAYTVYVETQPRGRTVDERVMIAELLTRYDAIRSEANSTFLSQKMIEEAVRRWT